MFSCLLDLELGKAMKTHNNIMPGDKFTLLDLNILCLAKSFSNTGNKLYMTNKQLGEYFMATEKTVQTSINRLCAAGFIDKEHFYAAYGVKKRNLIYNDWAVQKFLSELQEETNVLEEW